MAGIAEFIDSNMVNAGCQGRLHVPRVASASNRPYLDLTGSPESLEMPAILSNHTLSRPLVLVALVGALMLAATLALWTFYGTAVFFELVRAGWIACF
jgi:hypothetical protein